MSQALPKLSVCIATFNRAKFISETIESILAQMTSDCELVISDNASIDDTEHVVREYAKGCDRVRYAKQKVNVGLDRNYERAILMARGEYCWLMTDDDVLQPCALARVLRTLERAPSLVILNIEFRDLGMTSLLQRSCLRFDSDRSYGSGEMDRLFLELDEDLLMYIGSIVVRRDIWLARDRERYMGSLFVHTGTIFQQPLPGETLVIAQPLVSYRIGNEQSYAADILKVIFEQWPATVESLALSEAAKKQVPRARPWRHPKWLLLLRGWGFYSLREYRKWIRPRLASRTHRILPALVAFLPAFAVNAALLVYFSACQDRGRWLLAMKQSRHNWRVLLRAGWRSLRASASGADSIPRKSG